MNRPKRILIVDDEPQIRTFLKHGLEAAGYETLVASDGTDGLRQASALIPDLIILDLGLPDMDGKAVVSKLRHWSQVPVIILSARDDEREKIDVLDLGANDYVAKPFGIGELLARIRVALRQDSKSEIPVPSQTIFAAGPLSLDIAKHSVTRGDEPIKLTPKEFELLAMLLQNKGKVVTQRQLLTSVWGPAHVQDTQYLRVFVGQLRRKLEIAPSAPQIIISEPGVGYLIRDEI
jgi:two-component system, OmpR family, KDP operon response regulator KdpE